MDFTGYNLNFPINFGHAATQFLADMPTWVCLTAKTVQKIQIMACETSKMHCLQNLFFGLQTLMNHYFYASQVIPIDRTVIPNSLLISS